MLNFKGHRPRRRGKCAHYWVLESQDEAFKRSRSRKYSMGLIMTITEGVLKSQKRGRFQA